MLPRRILLLGLALTLSACLPHAPTRWDHEAFEQGPPQRVLGCVELGFSLDRETAQTSDASLLLDVSLHNLCLREVAIDLSRLRVSARDESGGARPVSMYDPRHEIHAMRLDSAVSGTERIRLDAGGSLDATQTICLDLGEISPDAAGAQPVCLFAPTARALPNEEE
jgi:hypothetical protein